LNYGNSSPDRGFNELNARKACHFGGLPLRHEMRVIQGNRRALQFFALLSIFYAFSWMSNVRVIDFSPNFSVFFGGSDANDLLKYDIACCDMQNAEHTLTTA